MQDDLRAHGQRLLLVQTWALPASDAARASHHHPAAGHGEEARVRDHLAAGDDTVLFREAL